MRTRLYDVFDEIMPHGQSPEPGTAADKVARHLLDFDKGETGIMHDQERRFDAVYCHVSVSTLAVRLS
jgi:uncharacterized protein YcaQ